MWAVTYQHEIAVIIIHSFIGGKPRAVFFFSCIVGLNLVLFFHTNISRMQKTDAHSEQSTAIFAQNMYTLMRPTLCNIQQSSVVIRVPHDAKHCLNPCSGLISIKI